MFIEFLIKMFLVSPVIQENINVQLQAYLFHCELRKKNIKDNFTTHP
jgi:hypothetical protein